MDQYNAAKAVEAIPKKTSLNMHMQLAFPFWEHKLILKCNGGAKLQDG